MRMQSAFTNGLLYGAIVGGIASVIPLLGALLGDAPLGEMALAGGATVLVWGALGFATGFASYRGPHSDIRGNPLPAETPSRFKYWLYRIVAGILLGYIAASAVAGVGAVFFFLVEYGWIGQTGGKRTPEDFRLFFIGCFGWMGGMGGAVAGCLLGALLTPGGNELGPVAKRAFVAAGLGFVAGCWLGGVVGYLQPGYFDETQSIALAPVMGGLGGLAGAVFMRMHVFR